LNIELSKNSEIEPVPLKEDRAHFLFYTLDEKYFRGMEIALT